VTPNGLTTARILTGLVAVWCYSKAQPNWAAAWWLVSALLDRADGELARIGGQSSRLGHLYDLSSDIVMDALIFVGIGIGLSRGVMGSSALIAGLSASVSVALIFLFVRLSDSLRSMIDNRDSIADPDDVMLLITPITWFGWLDEFLVVAGIGAPLFLALLLLWISMARLLRKETRGVKSQSGDSDRSSKRGLTE
jgi:phosphatidylglycerophosphate synthase